MGELDDAATRAATSMSISSGSTGRVVAGAIVRRPATRKARSFVSVRSTTMGAERGKEGEGDSAMGQWRIDDSASADSAVIDRRPTNWI